MVYPVECLGKIHNEDILLAASLHSFGSLIHKPQHAVVIHKNVLCESRVVLDAECSAAL